MTTNRSPKTRLTLSLLTATVLSTGALGILAEPAVAQQPSSEQSTSALLSIAEIERKVSAAGLQVTDIELRERVAEVEGKDGSGRKVEWIVDRHDGRILSRDLDD